MLLINDICLIPLSTGSKLVLYADDTTLYKTINSNQDLLNFQNDINKIFDWFSVNFLQANAKKTKFMIASTKQNLHPNLQLHMSNQLIDRVTSITFLGIHISSKLSWNIHIDTICKKARKIIGLIHRNFHLASQNLRRAFYISLVRPILEYGSSVWHPLTKTLTNRLEAVQRFACRVILQSGNLELDALFTQTNIPALEVRRDFFTLCLNFE